LQLIWQSAKIWQVFKTGVRTYFTLLADRFITYTNKIGPSATYKIMVCLSIVLMTLTGHGRVGLHRAQELVQHLTTPLVHRRGTTCSLRPRFQENQVTRHNY